MSSAGTGPTLHSPERVAIIIVSFQTDLQKLLQRIQPIAQSGYLHIIVDNTPGKPVASRSQIAPNVEYLPLGENFGIAAALNSGVKEARALKKQYIFTFDQDSEFDGRTISLLVNEYVQLRQQEFPASHPLAIGPHPINKNTGASYLRRKDRLRLKFHTGELLTVNEIITSGLLADDLTYASVGPYREDLFIDFVDHEWCWRLRSQGGTCLVNLSTPLPHMVGSGDIPLTFGMKLGSENRVYFLFRNGLTLILARKMPLFDSVKFLILIPAKLLIFALMPDRKARWRYAFRGLVDGWRRTVHR